MKPQRKAVAARKAQKTPSVIIAKKRRESPDESSRSDNKKIDGRRRIIEKHESEEGKRPPRPVERRGKMEESRRKAEEKKREKTGRMDEGRKRVSKEMEKKCETMRDKRTAERRRSEEVDEESAREVTEEVTPGEGVKRKSQKLEEQRAKTEKHSASESRRKNDVRLCEAEEREEEEEEEEEEKKKKGEEKTVLDAVSVVTDEENSANDEKTPERKRGTRVDGREGLENPASKEKKTGEKEQSVVGRPSSTATSTKESKVGQPPRKRPAKRVLVKKCNSPLAKKLIEKRPKLVKIVKTDEEKEVTPREEEKEDEENVASVVVVVVEPESKKKSSAQSARAGAAGLDKKIKLVKRTRLRPHPKSVKAASASKVDSARKITASGKRNGAKDRTDESIDDSGKTAGNAESPPKIAEAEAKECETREEQRRGARSSEIRKGHETGSKMVKKSTKRVPKQDTAKSRRNEQNDRSSMISDDASLEESAKFIKTHGDVEEKEDVSGVVVGVAK